MLLKGRHPAIQTTRPSKPPGHLLAATDERAALMSELQTAIEAARRARLARLTVEHVLPLWRAARPSDQDLEKLLEQVEGVLDGTVDAAEVNRAAGLLWSHVDNLILTPGPESPLLVGYAASKALTSALRDEPLDPPDADPDRTDFGRDPRRLDTAFVASTAAAGSGTPWDDASDPEQRRQFWTWWLDRAGEAQD